MKGREAELRNLIKGQMTKLAKIQKRIDELQQALDDYLSNPPQPSVKPAPIKIVDNRNYCGKILYVSKKAANAARKLINRDLIKEGKKPMKRAYFCGQCESWHLTTIPHWMPHPEHEVEHLSSLQ